MVSEVQYEHWKEFLFREGAICSPAELQGFITGILSSGARPESDEFLQHSFEFMDLINKPQQEHGATELGLLAFYEVTLKALSDQSLNFRLLLPDDAMPLADRTEALAEWAQGFLNGFGSAEKGIALKLDEDAQDALKDFANITQIDTEVEDGEDNEASFIELVEYLRVGVFSMFAQLSKDEPPAEAEPKAEDEPPALH